MASITICNLDDDLKCRLRVRAAENGRSMEEEVREILRHAVSPPSAPQNLGQSIHERFAAIGGVEISPIQREPSRAVREPE
jgi:antitoxin FitA